MAPVTRRTWRRLPDGRLSSDDGDDSNAVEQRGPDGRPAGSPAQPENPRRRYRDPTPFRQSSVVSRLRSLRPLRFRTLRRMNRPAQALVEGTRNMWMFPVNHRIQRGAALNEFWSDLVMFKSGRILSVEEREIVIKKWKSKMRRFQVPTTAHTPQCCVICYDDEAKEPVACNGCKQPVGCTNCVGEWFVRHRGVPSCPLCRGIWAQEPGVFKIVWDV
ncbi:hypothetical protein QR680_002788 [Steinernema hermaphroditum]|uniref:RING-type domain-containing protein n=1 Tax=Steinernema hermaphroditum TaxID=289476 RepID=A0AA39LIV5_9BILA|nr:hypothetical protein QR680_002788 [Steinernema hermaphroditum]